MRKLFLIFGIVVFAINVNAESLDSVYKARVDKNYLKSYLLDTRDFFIAPTKWDVNDWATVGVVTAATSMLFTQDLKIQQFAQKHRTATSDTITKYCLEPFGSGVYSMPLMALFYLEGTFFKNQRAKRVAMLGVKSYLISGALVNIPKFIFQRHRPYHNEPANPNLWEGPTTEFKYKSFISGHTTSAFAVATIVATEYRDKPIVPIISYGIAALAGLSRIHDNKHWASDVLGGAAFGWAIGKMIYNHNNWKLSITPYKNDKYTGMLITIPIK